MQTNQIIYKKINLNKEKISLSLIKEMYNINSIANTTQTFDEYKNRIKSMKKILIIYLAYKDKKLVAGLEGWHDLLFESKFWINHLFVDKKNNYEQIGLKLLRTSISDLRSNGVTNIAGYANASISRFDKKMIKLERKYESKENLSEKRFTKIKPINNRIK